MSLKVGKIRRQLATTITARTSFGELLGLGEFGRRLFIHAQHTCVAIRKEQHIAELETAEGGRGTEKAHIDE